MSVRTRLLSAEAAALACGVDTTTLGLWRFAQSGPPHITIGGSVFYP